MSDKQECSGAPDMTPGIISWNELVSRDADGSKKFYSQLFGWRIETMNMGPGADYTMMKAGDRSAAGLIRMPAEAGPAPTMWMSYVTVPNLEAAVAKAKALGAKICKDATTLPMGLFAIINDPQGATLGLWEFTKPA